MKNLKETFEQIIKLQKFAISRGLQLLDITEDDLRYYYLPTVEFGKEEVYVEIEDNYRYESTTHSVRITIEQLEMTDEQWSEYVQSVRDEKERQEQLLKDAKRYGKNMKTLREYNRLKEELGL